MTFTTSFVTTQRNFETSFQSHNVDFSSDFGAISFIRLDRPHYHGDYEAMPLVTTQVMPVKDYVMDDNVTIHMIQTRETDNASGGVTFEILG